MTQKVVKIPVKESFRVEQADGQPPAEPALDTKHMQEGCPEASEDLVQQVEKYKDLWMRAEAEVENRRKWAERRVQDRVSAERQRLLLAVLPVADNLERALQSEAAESDLQDGVALTHRELLRLLSAEGVSVMKNVIGQPFDPLYHEAVATVPSPGREGKVVEQTQAGYSLDGRPLRAARVIVGRSNDE
jgi:molecular chaperone GrpE